MGSSLRTFNMYKFVVLSVIVAAVAADHPPAYGAPPPAYHPAPYKEVKLAPQPYAYEYGVADDYSKATSRKPRPRMPKEMLLDLSPSLFPMVVSRPPPTPLITTTVSLPRSPTPERLSTPLSPQLDTDMPLPPTLPSLPTTLKNQ